MSAINNKRTKWQQVAGIGIICGLAVAGCSRSDKADTTETKEVTEQPAANSNTVTTAVACDNPMVQDRLKTAIKNTLNSQAQTLATSYANDAEISLNGGTVRGKVDSIVIDVQNAAVLQEANANGMTTCQASVSMTLPSEDLYQASQMQSANNQPSLQTRLAQDNIRVNNNMLVDDAFTYVAGAQGGQIQVRIAGRPTLITVVADIMAGSVLKSAMDSIDSSQRTQRAANEAARRREAAQNKSENQISRPSKPAAPAKPVQPAQPAKPAQPPSISQNGTPSAATPSTEAKLPTTPKAPASVPKDDSIDMVIIEDGNATY